MTADVGPTTSQPRRALVSSAIGNTIETYDWQIYGIAAGLVFGTVFFSDVPSAWASVFSFATLAIGFAGRPLGAFIFGHFGDTVGRRNLLILTLCGTGGCTMLIGMLPSRASIGIWAPLLLVTLRTLQGIFHGGERGGAILMAVEHAPAGRRGLYGGLVFLGGPLGALLANGAITLTLGVTSDSFETWGWRIPFLLSFVLLGLGLFMRLSVQESPKFEEVKRIDGPARRPLIDVIRESWRSLLLTTCTLLGLSAFVWLLLAYTLSYGTEHLGVEKQVMLHANLYGDVAWFLAIIFFAWLSDKISRNVVMAVGALFVTVYPFALFGMLDTGRPAVITVAIVIGYIGASMMYGPLPAFLTDLFPTRVAYSGVGIGWALGDMLGGALAPFVASLLLHASGGRSWSISLYLALCGLMTLVSVLIIMRSGRPRRGDLTPVPASTESFGDPVR